MTRSHELQQVRRFRANPIEVTFLSVISLIFMNSLYSLVYDNHGSKGATLTPMASHPTSEGRAIASVSSSLLNITLDCDKSVTESTSATRVRVSGLICGFNPSLVSENSVPPKIAVKNKTNQNAATVFIDHASGKFSTDYISLDAGENIIQVEIKLGTGKTISKEILISR
ncbi:MAG: hypothetical protein ABI041_10260 [Bdellovibrionia bacterium]